MLMELDRGGTCNRILQALSADDFGLLQNDLISVALPVRKRLETPNKPVESVYFLESGIASVIAAGPPDCTICVGLIGSEGATGSPVIQGTDRSPHETTVQFAGHAWQIPADRIRSAMGQSPTLHAALLGYSHTLTNQIAQTALANGWNTIEERLSRWLCMAHDRSDSDELTVTHERLGDLLGVRRPAITLALARLEQDRSIHVRRGSVAVVDRLRLEQKSGGMYGRSEREFERVFTPANGHFLQSRAIIDLAYHVAERLKSIERITAAEMRCDKQRILITRLEMDGKSSLSGRSLLTTMEASLDLMRKGLARTERAIELERAREYEATRQVAV